MSIAKRFRISTSLLVAVGSLLSLAGPAYTQNKVMGEVEFIGANDVEKHSGVWIDGEYVGYLSELKGDRRVLLLPGEHQVSVRQSGYKDFTQTVLVEPGHKQTVNVALVKEPGARPPAVTAEIKLTVTPSRAAVFVDDSFVGPVHDFGGLGRALLVSPGRHRIKIALPGYQTFETEANLLPNQKFTVKTDLVKGSIKQAGPLIKEQ
jgi:PEGA domain-containing protein